MSCLINTKKNVTGHANSKYEQKQRSRPLKSVEIIAGHESANHVLKKSGSSVYS
jgi:hypothetical protein